MGRVKATLPAMGRMEFAGGQFFFLNFRRISFDRVVHLGVGRIGSAIKLGLFCA
jgi:hypothetical protein